MVLVVHPHGYPQTMHNSWGHRSRGRRRPPSLSPVPSRNFTCVMVKDLSGRDVSVSMSPSIPWSKPMGALDTNPRPIICLYSCLIHNFPMKSGELSVLLDQIRHRRSMSYFLSMSQGLEGWYDATHLLPNLLEDENSGSVCGGRT